MLDASMLPTWLPVLSLHLVLQFLLTCNCVPVLFAQLEISCCPTWALAQTISNAATVEYFFSERWIMNKSESKQRTLPCVLIYAVYKDKLPDLSISLHPGPFGL